jgi:hypothetical protein
LLRTGYCHTNRWILTSTHFLSFCLA